MRGALFRREIVALSVAAFLVLIFTLGRLDVLPVDDFGVREG